MKMDAGAHIWKDFGIPVAQLKAKNFRFVKQSHESSTLFPIMGTAEDFQKTPAPNEVNIFIVKNGMYELLWDCNLQNLLEAKRNDLKNGDHFSKTSVSRERCLAVSERYSRPTFLTWSRSTGLKLTISCSRLF